MLVVTQTQLWLSFKNTVLEKKKEYSSVQIYVIYLTNFINNQFLLTIVYFINDQLLLTIVRYKQHKVTQLTVQTQTVLG